MPWKAISLCQYRNTYLNNQNIQRKQFFAPFSFKEETSKQEFFDDHHLAEQCALTGNKASRKYKSSKETYTSENKMENKIIKFIRRYI